MTQLSESLPLLNAHSGSVQRVLINLLNNAVDSLGQERRITIVDLYCAGIGAAAFRG